MRRRSPERVRAWRDLLNAWQRSGQTVNAVCRDRKLTRSNFDLWRRILAAEPARSKPPPFVPVRVVVHEGEQVRGGLAVSRRGGIEEASHVGHPATFTGGRRRDQPKMGLDV